MKIEDCVKGFISVAVVLTFLYLALGGEYKDALIAAVSTVLGYWLGSSQGSKIKTDALLGKQ